MNASDRRAQDIFWLRWRRGSAIPESWYNIAADLAGAGAAAGAASGKRWQPIEIRRTNGAADFRWEVIKQEVSTERFIPIPETRCLAVYRLWTADAVVPGAPDGEGARSAEGCADFHQGGGDEPHGSQRTKYRRVSAKPSTGKQDRAVNPDRDGGAGGGRLWRPTAVVRRAPGWRKALRALRTVCRISVRRGRSRAGSDEANLRAASLQHSRRG